MFLGLFQFPINHIKDFLNDIILEDDNIRVSNLILDHSIKCSGFLFEEKLFLKEGN